MPTGVKRSRNRRKVATTSLKAVTVSAVSTPSKRKSRAAALIGSLAVHALLLTGMVAGLRIAVLPDNPPPMQVGLYSSLFDLRKPQPRTLPKADSARQRFETPSPLPAPSPEMLRQIGPTNRALPRGPVQRGPMAEVTPFYRDHIPGCGKEDLALMDAEARDRCEKQISAQAVIDNGKMQAADRFATPILKIDPEKRAQFDRTLSRRREREGVPIDPMEACKGPAIGMGSSCINKNAKPN